jgi:uncharacterized membrane protein
VNLFLAGWALTQGFGPTYTNTKPDPAPEQVAEQIAEALPAADAELVRLAFADKRQSLVEARAKYLVALDHVRVAIDANPFDRQALDQAIIELRQTRQAERTIFGETIMDVVPKMSPQGRHAFVVTHMGGRS